MTPASTAGHAAGPAAGTTPDPVWFEALEAKLVADHGPRDAVESHLVWRLAMAIWRSQHAAQLETEIWSEGWSPARLNALTRYQAQQQRELKDALRLLDQRRRRRHVGVPEAADDAGLVPETHDQSRDRLPEETGLTAADLDHLECWLDRGGLQALLGAVEDDAFRPGDFVVSPAEREPANGNVAGGGIARRRPVLRCLHGAGRVGGEPVPCQAG